MRKTIEIDENTHRKLKVQSAKRGMTFKEYVEYLCDKDKRSLDRKEK